MRLPDEIVKYKCCIKSSCLNSVFNNFPLFFLQREELPVDSDSDTEKNDEKPVVVVLKAGDLTAEEAEALKEKDEQGEDVKTLKTFKKKKKFLNTNNIFFF